MRKLLTIFAILFILCVLRLFVTPGGQFDTVQAAADTELAVRGQEFSDEELEVTGQEISDEELAVTGQEISDEELAVTGQESRSKEQAAKDIDVSGEGRTMAGTDLTGNEMNVTGNGVADQEPLMAEKDSGESKTVIQTAVEGLRQFYRFTGFRNAKAGHLIMIAVGLFFIFLAIRFDYEPLLLIPIGAGIIMGNIPFLQAEGMNLQVGIYQEGSVMNYLYFGVMRGVYPPLIFLGIGAMTDFSSLISRPRLMLLGAAAQVGIFLTFLGALWLGFDIRESGAIGIIGGADGPTAIFLSSRIAEHLIGPIAIAAYSYMALVPVIQPPIMRLMTTKKERVIRMSPPRAVSQTEKILFPIIGMIITAFISPSSLPLLGMLFFGNLLKESTRTKRLAETARTSMIDIVTILLGLTVGASTQADRFLTTDSLIIFGLGALSFMVATAGGIIFAKVMNVFTPADRKLNPLIGAAGVSAVPDSARVVQNFGLREDPSNHLLMHAMAPNVAGVIGSAVAAGILLSFLW